MPVLTNYVKTGLVPNFPTLIVSGFIAMAAIISFFSGLLLETLTQNHRQDYEFRLQVINMQEKLIKRLDGIEGVKGKLNE